MTQVPVSVVIPTYNYAPFLPKALDSVFEQSVQPLEIWVADDGSTDNTEAIVASYGDKVKYRKFEHQGVYAIRQAMLRELQSDWFLNLDADNWLEVDFLDQMTRAIQENLKDSNLAFAYPDIDLCGEAEGRVNRPEFDVQELKRANFTDMNSLIRLSIARKYGFDSSFNSGQGDYDFFLTLAENGYHGIRVADAVLHYRVHDASITRSVGRKRRQVAIIKRILKKHRNFFNRDEAETALDLAKSRLMISLIRSRSPFAQLGKRLQDWWTFARTGWRHAEFQQQTRYCLNPGYFFQSNETAADVFMLFRDIPERRKMVQLVNEGKEIELKKEQLFGFADLRQKGVSVDCNLRLPRTGSVREIFQGWRERTHAPRTGIGLGDVISVRAHLWQINRAKVVVATTDNSGLPAARLKTDGKLKASLVYISVGLPERLKAVEGKSSVRANEYRKMLAAVDKFVAYGYEEAQWLREWLGPTAQVRFVPFGVDTEKWTPLTTCSSGVDIISIGADPMRDFDLLIDYARNHSEVSVCIITRPGCLDDDLNLPGNIQVKYDITADELQSLIAVARIVVLPVKENTYSGATTTLLQCMSMGKPVAVSRVGAVRDGYGFSDGSNLRWLQPGSLEDMSEVLNEMLADQTMCDEIGVNARKQVVEYHNWKRYVADMIDCLNEWLEH